MFIEHLDPFAFILIRAKPKACMRPFTCFQVSRSAGLRAASLSRSWARAFNWCAPRSTRSAIRWWRQWSPNDVAAESPTRPSTARPLFRSEARAKKTWKVRVVDIDWGRHLLKEPQERIREASREEERQLVGGDARGLRASALCHANGLSSCGDRRVDLAEHRFLRQDHCDQRQGRKRPASCRSELRDHRKASVFTYVARKANKRRGLIRGQRYPIMMEGFKTAWRRNRKGSGVENFRFHDTRHTAAYQDPTHRQPQDCTEAAWPRGHRYDSKICSCDDRDVRAAMEGANHTGNHTDAATSPPNHLEENKK